MHRFLGSLASLGAILRRPAVLLCAIPLALILFDVFGPYRTESALNFANIGLGVSDSTLPGHPTIDPNIGVTSFALGVRAARDVVAGILPLWNHYEGLGAPLLGGLQSAALFPPTLLLLLPHGQAIEQALLQLLGGWGAYLFFRRFGLGTRAALTGGMLFEVNGVFAWLRNAIFNPVAFLPWLLYAFERMRASAVAGDALRARAPTICLGGLMGALALYAGFPEVTYLYIFLVALWAVFRLTGLSRGQVLSVAADAALTGLLAFALSAPALTAFVAYLAEADVAGHANQGFLGQWEPASAILQYVLPYVYGPIWATFDPMIVSVWGGTGGYVGALPLVAALGALFVPGRRGAKLVLAGWIVIALGATHGWPGIYQAFMMLPLAKMAACYRYLNTSWIFCAIFLAALLVDDADRLPRVQLRRTFLWAGAAATVLIAAATVAAWPLIARLWDVEPGLRSYAVGAAAIAVGLFASVAAAAVTGDGPRFARVLAVLLVAEAATWFFVPFLSYPREGRIDRDTIAFLQANTGYHRVMASFTDRGYGLAPAYGSAFGIAALNYDNVPVPRLTTAYIKERLDPYATTIFLPWAPDLPPDKRAARAQDVHDRLSLYAAAGVKYVMSGPEFDPLKPVFQGQSMTIYEIPGARDYFTAPNCTLTPVSRDVVDSDCAQPSELLRLELYMSGWSATVDGNPAAVGVREGAFQGVALPAGKARVRFTYWPRGFTAAVAAAGAALLAMLLVFGRMAYTRRAEVAAAFPGGRAVWFPLAFVPLVAWSKDAAVVALVGAALAVLASPQARKQVLGRPGPVFLAGAAFWGWALAAIAWSPVHNPTDWLKAIPVIAAGAVTVRAMAIAPNIPALRLMGRGILAVLALFTLLTAERVTGGFIIGLVRTGDSHERLFDILSPGLALLACLAFPTALVLESLTGRKAIGWVWIAACLLLAVTYRMDAAPVAILAGLVAYGIVHLLGRKGFVLVVGGIAAVALFWGAVASLAWQQGDHTWLTGHINLNWGYRVEIWHRVQELIWGRPWTGHGFDTARILAQGPGVSFLHPHNGLLQVWLELGIVGVALFLTWVWMMLRPLARLRAPSLATAAATLTALSVFWLVSFGIWQGWWLAAIGLTASALALALRIRSILSPPQGP